MSHLVLELRPGETMLVNGAAIRFRNRCRVELVSKARFLFGKQILEDHDGASVPEQLYCAIQALYVGQADNQAEARARVDALLVELDGTILPGVPDAVGQIGGLIDRGELYAALKLLRGALKPAPMNTAQPRIAEAI
ncbi:flagellar biosynthesis repressor FlbT [Acetobacteraceae bacterium KSS8]|uniref:Flagellar biosynthesis repressor FlbT n=1 Tax=Endosaccharibacter trunci TaxID=2812733 RepID=A0ABT1W9N8_9PROT|nr:flagellar biosynthesis repressor FlbT [Acetobacteraceae bacterium KSS8]